MDQVMLVCFAVWLVMLTSTQGTHAYLCFLNSEPDQMSSMNYRWSIHERDLCGCTSLRLGTKYKSLQCTKNRWDLQQWMQCDQRIKRWAPFKDCRDLYDIGVRTNGEYTIFAPRFDYGIRVFCDMDDGGWIVIQRRKDGTVDFNRTWDEYSAGFGSLRGEFWWGHKKIRNLTFTSNGQRPYWELSVTVAKPNGNSGTAIYGLFFLTDEMFTLTATFFREGSGEPIGDALLYNDYSLFSTYDQDNEDEADIHCANVFGAGWWYKSCHSEGTMDTNLNGVYGTPQTGGIVWKTWKQSRSLSFTEMKTRLSLE